MQESKFAGGRAAITVRGGIQIRGWQTSNQSSRSVDALGFSTTFSYDAVNHRVGMQKPSGGIWTTEADGGSRNGYGNPERSFVVLANSRSTLSISGDDKSQNAMPNPLPDLFPQHRPRSPSCCRSASPRPHPWRSTSPTEPRSQFRSIRPVDESGPRPVPKRSDIQFRQTDVPPDGQHIPDANVIKHQ